MTSLVMLKQLFDKILFCGRSRISQTGAPKRDGRHVPSDPPPFESGNALSLNGQFDISNVAEISLLSAQRNLSESFCDFHDYDFIARKPEQI